MMTTQNSENAAYFVPGDIVFGFRIAVPPDKLRQSPYFGSPQALATYLEKQKLSPVGGFDLDEQLVAQPFQTVLPVPSRAGRLDHTELSTILARMRLKNSSELPEYVARVFQRLKEDAAKQLRPPSIGEPPRLTWIQPNWFGGFAQGHIGTGGPGGRPRPVTTRPEAQATQFSFPGLEQCIAQETTTSAPTDVIDVYILDTLPDKPKAKGACAGDPQSVSGQVHLPEQIANKTEFERHPLGDVIKDGFLQRPDKSWKAVSGDLTFTWAEDLRPGVFASLMEPPPNEDKPAYYVKDHDSTPPDEPYEVSDHGIFIAGIIKQIVPKARIHLIQVLNRYGVGTVESVANGFAEIARLRSQGKAQSPYLVNCSFTFTTPVLDELFKAPHVLPEEHPLYGLMNDKAFQASARRLFEAMVPSVERLGQSLKEIQGSGENCLVIAAAGNDSDLLQNIRLDARYPANVGSVLGVGALTRDFKVWDYSNVSDTPAVAGLMALGVVQNVFTQAFPGGQPNPDGFAEWAGTSFATPVITGYVAKVCLERGLSPRQALAFLVQFAHISATGEAVLEITQPLAVPVP